MLENITRTFKGLLLNPSEEMKKLREEPLEEAFVYYLVLSAVFVVLMAVASVIFMAVTLHASSIFLLVYLVGYLIGGYIGCFIGLIIGSIILHVFVYCLGGRKGLEATIKAAIYSFTPIALIGWIPVVGIIGSIWSLVLEAIAIRDLHEISTARAVIAVILTILFILAAIFLIVIFMVIVIFLLTQTSDIAVNDTLTWTM